MRRAPSCRRLRARWGRLPQTGRAGPPLRTRGCWRSTGMLRTVGSAPASATPARRPARAARRSAGRGSR
eukprot:571415-Alexandrium_andersonii.AAC.1